MFVHEDEGMCLFCGGKTYGPWVAAYFYARPVQDEDVGYEKR